MIKAFMLALAQLPERELRRPLLDTLLWTFAALMIIGFGLFRALQHLAVSWHESNLVAAVSGLVLMTGATWFLFVIVENAILFCYANAIVLAVERKHYPSLPAAPGMTWSDALVSASRLLIWTVLGNLLLIPCYLFMVGANIVLFLLLNGYLLGRGYFDAVVLRRLTGTNVKTVWRRHRFEFAILGTLSMIFLTVPFLNLFVPIIGLAVSVHLLQTHS